MLAAGLVAKKAVERGLDVPPYVKTSPGAGIAGGHALSGQIRLDRRIWRQLGFHTVGYGCTTCIGN